MIKSQTGKIIVETEVFPLLSDRLRNVLDRMNVRVDMEHLKDKKRGGHSLKCLLTPSEHIVTFHLADLTDMASEIDVRLRYNKGIWYITL